MTTSGAVSIRDSYEAVIRGGRRDGPRGRIAFCTWSADLDAGRGDLYVALGLATALAEDGWGVSIWPLERWGETGPREVDVAIVMIESHIPGLIPDGVRTIAWVRNWADAWARLPYLDRFDAIWCSSEASRDRLRTATKRPLSVVPLAADPELFRPGAASRDPRPLLSASSWGADRGVFRELRSMSKAREVVWYGVRADAGELPPGIDYRGRADYFDLAAEYGTHAIVLDDVIDPAAEYGNQNSRLFEALAAGALVVTNTSNGLAELGLGEVPVYEPGGLGRLLDGLEDDPYQAAELAARLRATVIQRHTWPIRAASVGALVEESLETSALPRQDPILALAAESQARYRDAAGIATALQREVEALRTELDAVHNSTSWRITAPARALRSRKPAKP